MNFPTTINPAHYSALSAKQEGFAGAHIRAVCASLGCGVSKPEPDDDKIDFTISSKVDGREISKPKIDLQSKCMLMDSSLQNEDADFGYTVDQSLYDSLRDIKVSTPRLLVVTLVPKECSSWIKYSHHSTSLSYCSYWYSLKGMPPLPRLQKSKRLRIPKDNIFSAEFIHTSMQRIANGEYPFVARGEADE
ncbi:DUF4365 domain-containing protein [Phaeobacter sp. QD34_3]|uniref:DUF4365 domain-containing protein n=1 Tax=unclassified Phaeobacter TaxID=2621772 RepID=UPI00237EF540|nr:MULTISPECIES: DUF4365 domain-containing protein [unclassified Phaeobacter]MDE4133732.1 DUF4365 domain-containing protein [Phaeobacter sp. QD34_3]MDE4137335.1 DUF4365 domain-containing protein [Phaeobacter sp. QD34_24]